MFREQSCFLLLSSLHQRVRSSSSTWLVFTRNNHRDTDDPDPNSAAPSYPPHRAGGGLTLSGARQQRRRRARLGSMSGHCCTSPAVQYLSVYFTNVHEGSPRSHIAPSRSQSTPNLARVEGTTDLPNSQPRPEAERRPSWRRSWPKRKPKVHVRHR